MLRSSRPLTLVVAIAAAIHAPAILAAEELATIEVTTSKLAEPVAQTPAMVSVISGEELRAPRAVDLRTALSLVAGVDIAPGGDAGPAASGPGMWGLREFDAVLLVVDGITSRGGVNEAMTTLDLTNVERIEVLRGAAPVMYGATSFVGVIHVIHRQPGSRTDGTGEYRLGAGNYSSGLAAVSLDLPALGNYKQSLTVNGE